MKSRDGELAGCHSSFVPLSPAPSPCAALGSSGGPRSPPCGGRGAAKVCIDQPGMQRTKTAFQLRSPPVPGQLR